MNEIVEKAFLVLRIINTLGCLVLLGFLVGGYIRHGARYNKKTLGYWYSRVMWCLVGAIASSNSAIRMSPETATTPAITIAISVTFYAMFQKGSWGYVADIHKVERTRHL